MNIVFQKIVAFFMAVGAFFSGLFGWIKKPADPQRELDLSGYELVFCDEFDGNALDMNVWRLRTQGEPNGFIADSQVSVNNGIMTITAQYLENGAYGAGWYSGVVALRQNYRYGYFEIKCKCAAGAPFFSAFWLQSEYSYIHELSKGGVGGAEIDIFEAYRQTERSYKKYNSVATHIFCNGGDSDPENIDGEYIGDFQGTDIYNTYNTYGLEWTESEYIFYINGVETARSSFSKGVSQVPEEVIVSLEIGDPTDCPKDFSTTMVVDYVKIYQKP